MFSTSGTSSPRRSPRIPRTPKGGPHPYKNPTKRKHPSRVSKNQPQRLPTTEPGQTLYLRVNRKLLLLMPAATEDQPNPQPLPPLPGTTGNLYVITADVPDLHPFAGDTVDWLIKLARLLFEPLGTSSLYTFTTETVEWWFNREMDPSLWRKVKHGEQLRATIYEFCPDNDALIMLTRMSLRRARSVTTNASSHQAATFCSALRQRDRACIITQHPLEILLVASHLIPRRLGDAGVRSVMQRFTGSSTPVDRFDPTIGVLLFSPLDILADGYQLGFWNNGPDQYVVHSFVDMPLNYYGGLLPFLNDSMLHGRQITLSIHDASISLPPVGVFDWHYVQCVLKRFSTAAYQEINNIYHFTFPFRTRDDDADSDIEFDDDRNIADPPYPSYLWDLSALREHQRLEAEECNHAIMTWSSGVL